MDEERIMNHDLDSILRDVAAGRITPEEADALIGHAAELQPAQPSSEAAPRRAVRLQVTERGRSVVDLRIPMSMASMAGSMVPGLASAQMDRIRDAIRAGEVGPILDIRDDRGDGVVISTE